LRIAFTCTLGRNQVKHKKGNPEQCSNREHDYFQNIEARERSFFEHGVRQKPKHQPDPKEITNNSTIVLAEYYSGFFFNCGGHCRGFEQREKPLGRFRRDYADNRRHSDSDQLLLIHGEKTFPSLRRQPVEGKRIGSNHMPQRIEKQIGILMAFAYCFFSAAVARW
jgi:hypothetical protein